jgi:hypothetical protein
VGPRAGLDDVEKRKYLTLPGLGLRQLGELIKVLFQILSQRALTSNRIFVIYDMPGYEDKYRLSQFL